MAQENAVLMMDQPTKEILRMIKNMGMKNFILLVEVLIKEIGMTVTCMEKTKLQALFYKYFKDG